MGFCDMLGAPCGMPFIFANCDGTGSDVTVYTHELGHGLQGYLSYRSQPLADYVGLSPDLAEVHSKTMELLTLPYARDFFGPHAPQFLTEHRYDFIKELCAFCSIHTFETWLYEHPDASLSQWAEEFDRTEKAFGRAQNNEPVAAAGAGWLRSVHQHGHLYAPPLCGELRPLHRLRPAAEGRL